MNKIDPDRAAMYAAVAAAPDDDLPRLVFADWLDERGEHDQADFIRYMITAPTWGRTDPIILRGNRSGSFTNSATFSPWGHADLMALLRKRQQKVDVITVRNSTSGVVWYRGFMMGIHCSGTSITKAIVRHLRTQPIIEVRLSHRLRKEWLPAGGERSRGPHGVLRWHGHESFCWSRPVDFSTEALKADTELIRCDLPTVREVHYDPRPMRAVSRFEFLTAIFPQHDTVLGTSARLLG